MSKNLRFHNINKNSAALLINISQSIKQNCGSSKKFKSATKEIEENNLIETEEIKDSGHQQHEKISKTPRKKVDYCLHRKIFFCWSTDYDRQKK